MLPSLHDDFLVSYEVNCETRQIKRVMCCIVGTPQARVGWAKERSDVPTIHPSSTRRDGGHASLCPPYGSASRPLRLHRTAELRQPIRQPQRGGAGVGRGH
jgi:hypothetical protein